MDVYKKIKWVCGSLLIATFFMPLSRCYYIKHPVESALPNIEMNETESQSAQYEDIYAYRTFQVNKVQSWVLLLAFTWPVLLVALGSLRPKIAKALLPVEPIACVGSGVVLATLLDADRILWGGYLAILALSVYFFIALIQFSRQIRGQYIDSLRSP